MRADASLPEIAGSLFAQQFGWIVRAADGPGVSALLGRAPAPAAVARLTAAALVVDGTPPPPGLRVRAARPFEELWFAPLADPSGDAGAARRPLRRRRSRDRCRRSSWSSCSTRSCRRS